jgi:hypothetical protein
MDRAMIAARTITGDVLLAKFLGYALMPSKPFKRVRSCSRSSDQAGRTSQSGRRDNSSRDVKLVIFTIGHSTRPIDVFIRLLKAHGVQRLIDGHTIPRSRYNPQFNRVQPVFSVAPRQDTLHTHAWAERLALCAGRLR